MIEQKAVAACIEYTKLSQEIAALTKKIGEYGDACFNESSGTGYFEAHLSVFFKSRWHEEDPMTLHDLEDNCEHCFAAYQVILQRKEARKRLGVIKRKLIAIGKKAIVTPEETNG